MHHLDLDSIISPCYVIDRTAIEANLQLINRVRSQTGARVLLALKGFALWRLFGLIGKYLDGTAASSLYEAQLAKEHFGPHAHLYAPAYREDQFGQLMQLVDHINFNSLSQWKQFRDRVTNVASGIRINPEISRVKAPLYDPTGPCSHMGVTSEQLKKSEPELDGITGLHFHALCQSGADDLEKILYTVEQKFGRFLDRFNWINFGGGHLITDQGYDIQRLVELISRFQDRHNLTVYLEPSEAVVLNAGVLVATVLDLVHNEIDIAILDTSATAHMPDVLEMPYRPRVTAAAGPGQKPHTYRLAGLTCLAGDVIGDYSFDHHLRVGDRLVFEDMAQYTMVKNTNFNGVNLPSIAIHDSIAGQTQVVRQFGYEDYKNRLS